MPLDGNSLDGRFMLDIKSKINVQTVFKARYVIGGHVYLMKDLMVHYKIIT